MNAVVAGVGMTRFGKALDRSAKDLVGEAVTAALEDAGVTAPDIDVVYCSNAFAGLLWGQESVRAQTVLAPLGIRAIPVVNVENACAGGSTAFRLAVSDVSHGEAGVALAVGFEKMYHEDRQRTFDALATARDVEEGGSEEGSSPFMELYAEEVREHMQLFGSLPEDFARVSEKNRRHGASNALAQFREPVDVDEVLASPMIVAPLTRLMCSPISDGAAATVITPRDAGRTGPVVRASVLRTGAHAAFDDPNDLSLAAQEAYEAAGVGPEDVDVAEVHDAASPAEIIAYEGLGFARPGEGAELVRRGDTHLGGRLPVNPSGGLLARGHPVGATGLAQIAEIVYQLRGTAGDRQVPDARVGLVHNSGGWVAGAAAALAVHVLSRG